VSFTTSALRCLALAGLLFGCAPGRVGVEGPRPDAPADAAVDDAPPSPPPDTVALRVGSRGVDCARVSVVGTGATARVTLGSADDFVLSVGGVEATLERDADGRGVTTVDVGEAAARLEVRDHAGDARCVAWLRHHPVEAESLIFLDDASETPVTAARSDDTGGVSELVLHADFPGDTVDDRAAYFLEAYGAALGVDHAQLLLVERRTAADGWQELLYAQQVGDRRVFGAFLTLSFDADRSLRAARSSLIPALTDPGAPASSAAAARDRTGEAPDDLVELVVYDTVALRGAGAPGARLGWWIDGALGAALVDDASGEVETFSRAIRSAAHIELHDANLMDSTLPTLACDGFGLICSWNFVGSAVFLEGASDAAAPTVVNPAIMHPHAESLWRMLGQSADFAEEELGLTGWAAFSIHPLRTQRMAPMPAGTVRAIVDPQWGDNAAYAASLRTLFFDDESFMQDPDVVCHEYGHAVAAETGPANGVGPSARQFDNGSLSELSADLFAIYCEAVIDPARDPWLIADVGTGDGPVRSIPDARNGRFTAGYRHYDEYRGSGDDDLYRPTFLVTRALHRAVTVHGLPLDRARPLATQTPAWNDLTTYPEFRDRWLSTARSWAEDGRFGMTDDDVCAMARGFRDTGLDGDYGATFAGDDVDPAAGASTDEKLVCTEETCPLCDTEEAPEPPLCDDDQLRGPTCTNAYGEAICLDAVSDVSEDCPEVGGVQSVRSCICVPGFRADGPPRWAYCSRSCRIPTDEALPADEVPPPSTGGGGGGRDTCAVSPASGPPGFGALAMLLALIGWRRRPR